MNYRKKTKDFLATVFPSTVPEWTFFLMLLFCYLIWALYIAQNFRIVYDERIPWDAYFSFDNRAIVTSGGGFERHPLSKYFFDILRSAGLQLSNGRRDSVFRIFLSVCSAVSVSFSALYVFKYLRNILRLNLTITVLLMVFYSFTSTCILLSFTPETYTYTLLFLSFFTYYVALKLRKNQEIPLAALLPATIITAGLTITNIVKIYIPLFYEKDLFKIRKVFFTVLLRSVISIGAFILLYLYRLNFNYSKIFSKTGEQYEKFSKPKNTPVWDMIVSWFFGGNVNFSSFVIRDYHSASGFPYKALFMDTYTGFLPYAFTGLLFILLILSVVKNIKVKLVQILAASFIFDIAIHCVLKFGLHTSYIYGGHFIFVFPLLLGWLFYKTKNPAMNRVLFGITILIVFFQLTNNLFRIEEFLKFLNIYYR